MSVGRHAVVVEAKKWVGVPYHRQGYVRAGCDCFGLIAGIALALGLPGWEEWKSIPKYHDYPVKPDPKLIVECCNRFMLRIPKEEATTADVVLMEYAKNPIYFALLTSGDPPVLIHAISIAGKVVEHRIDARWRSHIVRAYSLPGVA